VADTESAFRQSAFGFAADLADAAFAKEVVINQPWTDWKGERHEEDDWSAGIDACDARYFGPFKWLSDLPRIACVAIDAWLGGSARWLPLQAALSKTAACAPQTSRQRPDQVAAGKALAGAPLGYVLGPEDLVVDPMVNHSGSIKPIAGMRRCLRMA
jgi:hypothetical protein